MFEKQDTDRLRDIVTYWSEIQAEIKRAEQISRLAVGPAVNELRYAGRMLVAAFVKELDINPIPLDAKEEEDLNGTSLAEKIVVVEQYLTNADNDISDALLYFFQKRVDDLNSRYGAAAIEARHPKYTAFLKHLDEARILIIESRRDIRIRKKNYKKIKIIRETLIEDYFDLQKADAIMNIELYKINRVQKRFKYLSFFLGGLCVLLVAILITG